MKLHFLGLAFFLTYIPGFSQDSTKWNYFTSIGLQQHDKRLFDYPLRSQLENQNEFPGTYQFSIGVVRKLAGKNNFNISGGFGLAVELSTFKRPFNHRHGGRIGDERIHITDRYYKYLLQIPFKSQWNLNKKWKISLDAVPQMDFLTVAKESHNYKHSWLDFNLYSLELNPGIILLTHFAEFGLQIRALQIKKVDKILFDQYFMDPKINKAMEFYNPFKINLTMSHVIEGRK